MQNVHLVCLNFKHICFGSKEIAMTYNDPDIRQALSNIDQRKKKIRSKLMRGEITFRLHRLGTLDSWAWAFNRKIVPTNPTIPS